MYAPSGAITLTEDSYGILLYAVTMIVRRPGVSTLLEKRILALPEASV